ncbi:transcriptional regulator [Actinoplanes bogorensis]|uniref:Transcriptional regulator n=1 Tax=Paractinoplanes bogorensis TaxID=1610840 RepID=A0ABS5Z3G9_9ACTN|nr:sugar-binding domain-containing protein [Actinoplanes bogorensis]MBU2670237.1 transcriptional regulator [Actinoplanes bogorensis]
MEHLVAGLAARRFYLDGRTKKQIGDELGISRFKVARLLDQALRDGIVRIEIDVPPEIDLELSERLAARYGLRQAIVVRAADRRQLARVCAAVLAQRLSDDDVLGVSWGQTLHALTDVLPRLPRAAVVQMVGSIPAADLQVTSLELLKRLGESTGGPVLGLHAPMIVDSPQIAASLRSADYVASTVAAFPSITCAIVGVGSWRPHGSSVRAALPPALAARLDAEGAVADICSTVLNAAGEPVGGTTVADLSIAITTDQLRAIPDVMAIAGGAGKATAIAAAIKAGLLHRLITDTSAAQALTG